MNRMPRVSVIMSAYNAQAYLREAIESILNQTFSDFEFLIIDDGSTDSTAAILDSYQDVRIVRVKHETNIGHARGLNEGLQLARGEFIARMDADDISVPERFAEQVRYLDQHPQVAVLATWVQLIRGEVVSNEVWMPSSTPAVLAWQLTWRCPIGHPSIMMRRASVVKAGGYQEHFRYAEDRDLWIRLIQAGEEVSALPKALLQYRVWPSQIGTKHQAEQQEEGVAAAHPYVQWLLQQPVPFTHVRNMVSLYAGKQLAAYELHAGLALAYRVQARCETVFAQAGGEKIRDHVSDALIHAAANALKDGGKRHARSRLWAALRLHPWRAARPNTFRLMAVSL